MVSGPFKQHIELAPLKSHSLRALWIVLNSPPSTQATFSLKCCCLVSVTELWQPEQLDTRKVSSPKQFHDQLNAPGSPHCAIKYPTAYSIPYWFCLYTAHCHIQTGLFSLFVYIYTYKYLIYFLFFCVLLLCCCALEVSSFTKTNSLCL